MARSTPIPDWRLMVASCAVMLAGCAAEPGKMAGACLLPMGKIISRVDTKTLADELAIDICNPAGEQPPTYYRATLPLLVPDAVDIHTYQPNAFGLSISELFRESINKRCLTPVKQVEMARNFNLSPGGLVALSRETMDLREMSVALPTAMVTTYDVSADKLVVIARAVRIEDSVITRISSREVSWRCSPTFSGAAEINYTMK